MSKILCTIAITSAFWLLAIGYGSLYALFNGLEIRLPAATEQAQTVSSVFDAAENSITPVTGAKHHGKGK
jgi:hypothetical protein